MVRTNSAKLSTKKVAIILAIAVFALFGTYLYNINYFKNLKIIAKIYDIGNETDQLDNIGQEDSWTCMTSGVCIYNAYWDNRPGQVPQVVSFGVGPNRIFKTSTESYFLSCYVLVENEIFQGKYISSKMTDSGGVNNLVNTPAFFNCIWKGSRPTHVAFVNPSNPKTTLWLRLKNITVADSGDIAICVRPFFGKQVTIQLAAFIAFYSLLGVKHFTFYDYQTADAVKRFLRKLTESGYSLELIPWKAPEAVLKSWQMAQSAFTHDCVFRNAPLYTYVMVIDTDEFIVPKINLTFPQLLRNLERKEKNAIGAFHFRHVVFCDDNSTNDTLSFLSQVHHSNIWKTCARSKYIVRANALVEALIHCVIKLLKPFESVTVPEELALLHHRCREKTNTSYVDDSILKYRDIVLNSEVLLIWNNTVK